MMILYRAKYKKECIKQESSPIVKMLCKNDEWIYLIKHEYDLSNHGKKFEYMMLNNFICLDISELEFIEECPKINKITDVVDFSEINNKLNEMSIKAEEWQAELDC